MAAKKRLPATRRTIAKIQTTIYVKALHEHILGKKLMTHSQVTAALGLIRKVIPDLAAVHVEAVVDQKIEIKWRS